MSKIQTVICPVCRMALSCKAGMLKLRVRRHYEKAHANTPLSEGALHQLIISANEKGHLKLGRMGISSNQSIYTLSGGAPGTGKKR